MSHIHKQITLTRCIFLLLLLGGTSCSPVAVTTPEYILATKPIPTQQPLVTASIIATASLDTSNISPMMTTDTNEIEQLTDMNRLLSETPTNPVQGTLEPTIERSLLIPQKIISSNDIQDIWWSPDSNTLYYGVLFEGNFSYDLKTKVIKSLSLDDLIKQTPESAIIGQLPSTYRFPFISPSESRAVYIKSTDAPPVPTVNPNIEGGESSSDSHITEMWLWENGSSQSLGKIKQCKFYEHFWTPDEAKVVLVEYGVPMVPCQDVETQAWLLDVPASTLHPLFPTSELSPLRVYGFSPSGNYLLVGFFSDATGANLHLLNMNSLDLVPLQAPIDTAFQWLDEYRILVEYRGELQYAPYPIGIFDIQTMEFTNILPTLDNVYIKNVHVSPNNEWVAFSTGTGHFSQNDLWIMELSVD